MSIIFSQMWVCGRIFSDIGAFTRHEKTCKRCKKRLLGALEKAKEIYESKKLASVSILMAAVRLERSILLSPYRTTWYVPLHMLDCIKLIAVALRII
jgi:hypothetical protein